MGIQAVVSVVKGGQVIVKCVCGCNGMQAKALADKIREQKLNDWEAVRAAARKVDFGCEDCLIVGDKAEFDRLYRVGDCTTGRYLETFSDPRYNPRWLFGSADYVEVVSLDGSVVKDALTDAEFRRLGILRTKEIKGEELSDGAKLFLHHPVTLEEDGERENNTAPPDAPSV